MDTTKSVMFFDKCRLCLYQHGVSNIFDTNDLPQNIFIFTGVKVKQSDNLPQKICSKCLEVIQKIKELRVVARDNDALLHSLFGDKEEETEMDSKEEHPVTDTLSKDKNYKTKRNNSDRKHNEIKRSTSTSSNQTVNEEKKKMKMEISIRKDLFETSKVERCSAKAEEKEEEKLPKHKMIKKADGQEEYICGVCNKHYKTWKKLYLHNRLHNKKIVCPLDACGKKFATKGDLEKHLRTHTGVKPYGCDVCDKSFSQQGTLKVHKETVHYSFTFS